MLNSIRGNNLIKFEKNLLQENSIIVGKEKEKFSPSNSGNGYLTRNESRYFDNLDKIRSKMNKISDNLIKKLKNEKQLRIPYSNPNLTDKQKLPESLGDRLKKLRALLNK